MEIKEIALGTGLDQDYVTFINTYRGNLTSLEAFRWQFSHIPEQIVVTAIMEEEEKIIGSQSMMPIEIHTPKEKLISAKSENTYLDPSLRGKRMFAKIFAYAWDLCQQKNIHVVWGFTPALKAFARVGFEVYENCLISSLLYTKVPPLRKILADKKGPSVLVGMLNYFFILFTVFYLNLILFFNRFSAKKQLTVLNEEKNEEDMDNLYAKISEQYPSIVYIKHSKEYLAWRLDQNPNMEFTRKYFYSGEKLIGYCFYYMFKGTASISSLAYLDENHLKPLIYSLINSLQKDKIPSLIFHGNYENEINKQVFHLLKGLNFRKVNKVGQHFIYMFSDQSTMNVPRQEDWFINNLWTEGY